MLEHTLRLRIAKNALRLRVTLNLVMLSLSKHTQVRAQTYPSTAAHKNAHRLRVTIEENLTRHAEPVEAYPVPRSNIPFDFGSQNHSPAQGDAQPRHAEPVELYSIPRSNVPFDIGS